MGKRQPAGQAARASGMSSREENVGDGQRQRAQRQRQRQQQAEVPFPLLELPDELLGMAVAAAAAASGDGAAAAGTGAASGLDPAAEAARSGVGVSNVRSASKRLSAAHDTCVTELTLLGNLTLGCERRAASQQELDDLTRLVTKCSGLTGLALTRMAAREVPAALPPGVCRRLLRLRLEDCAGLAPLAACASSLQQLTVRANHERPGMGLPSLLPQLQVLTTLRTLDVYACNIETGPGSVRRPVAARTLERALSGLVHLTRLRLQGGIASIGEHTLASLTALQELHVWQFDTFHAASLTALVRLQRLELTGFALSLDSSGGQQRVPPAVLPGSLTDLSLHACGASALMPEVCALPQLRRLDLGMGSSWHGGELGPLSQLGRLERLCLRGNRVLASLAPLAGLRRLQVLQLQGFEALADCQFLSALTQLRELHLLECDCPAWRDLRPLSHLTRLKELSMDEIEAVGDLAPLQGLPRLKRLSLVDLLLEDLTPLSGLTQLQALSLRGCYGMTSLAPLSCLTRLQRLDLSGCDGPLPGLAPLRRLTQLRELDLSECEWLSRSCLRPLQALARQHGLRIVSEYWPACNLLID